jgi:hypothetical protein
MDIQSFWKGVQNFCTVYGDTNVLYGRTGTLYEHSY